ncbi:MAG: VCBS repeat-containing protein [Planctomycetes bacterium]|nr:VCBS repeat-containing protein [Planctomycetota bacterium]
MSGFRQCASWVIGVLLLGGSTSAQTIEYHDASYGTTGFVRQIEVLDLNGDAIPDIVSTNGFDVFLRLGVGDGQFGSESAIAFGDALPITGGDFDGDGRSEIVLQRVTELWLIEQEIDGSITETLLPHEVPLFNAMLTVDVNDDGALDIVGSRPLGNQVLLLFGDGTGSFSEPLTIDFPPIVFPGVATVTKPTVIDWNGDGSLDVIALEQGKLYVAVNFGGGTFLVEDLTTPLGDVWTYAAADFTGDGVADIAAATADRLWLLEGNQTYDLATADSVAIASMRWVEGVDLDGDGVAELAHIADTGETTLRGGSASSGYPVLYSPPGSNNWLDVGIGDINGDLVPDFVCRSADYAGLRLLRSGSAPAFVRGDCAADQQLDLGDAIAMLGVLFLGDSTSCADACDVQDDGLLRIDDAIYLVQYLFIGGPPPATPGVSCGVDSTAIDFLDCGSTSCP